LEASSRLVELTLDIPLTPEKIWRAVQAGIAQSMEVEECVRVDRINFESCSYDAL